MQVPSRTYKEEKMRSCDIRYPYMNNIKQRKINKVESSHLDTADSTYAVQLLSILSKSNRHYSKFKGNFGKGTF